MSGIKALTKLLGELQGQLKVCMRCGMCMAVCPLFAETGLEADVARGKMALLDGLLLEMFKNPKGVSERLNRCLLCGSCAAYCPGGVNAMEIFIKSRAILTGYMGLNLAKKAAFRLLLAHPKTFDRLMELGILFQKIFTRPVDEQFGTSCARIVSPLVEARHFVPLAPVPFHHRVSSLNSSPSSSGPTIRVAFFVGCLIDKVFPHVAQATVDALTHNGVGLFIPGGEGCCGIPAISSGDRVAFNRLVRHNLERLSGSDFDFLVTACATCTFTIKKIWPMMVQNDAENTRTRVEKIAKKTLDISQFLVSEVGIKSGVIKRDHDAAVVSYHDPCHLSKSLGVSDEPRALIGANPHYRLREMPEADWCCGMGGSFNLKYYKLSADIGKRKQANIMASGCSAVATGCPACMIQISDMLSKSGSRVVVKHPIEIYAASLNDPGKNRRSHLDL